MYRVILILHIIVAVLLIMIILLQIGRGATLSGLFGGGSTEAFLGAPSGDIFLKRVTVIFAVIFILTSLSLTIMSTSPKTVLRSNVRFPVSQSSSQNIPQVPKK